MENNVVNGVAHSSTTEQESSNDANANVNEPLLGKNNIHRYDGDLHLPSSSPEFDVLSVSVSPPPLHNNNALHLHLPPSSGDVHIIEPSVVVLPDSEGYLETTSLNLESEPELTNATHRPPPRVRFRSRVRIASGVHHHNHHNRDSHSHSQLTSHSAESVDSESSPCSSISAPLRYTPDDSDARPSYSFAAASKSKRRRSRRRALVGIAANVVTEPPGPGERAPLLRAPGSRLGARTRRLYGELDANADADEDEERGGRPGPGLGQRGRTRVVNEEGDGFGRWPWRLLNGYWWAWKCGTIVSCCCPADDEDEDENEHENEHEDEHGNGS